MNEFEMKKKEWWVVATGHQYDSETCGSKLNTIDLTEPGEDRWIYTSIQSCNPGGNSVAVQTKYLHLVECSAYDTLAAKLKEVELERDAAREAFDVATSLVRGELDTEEENARLKAALELAIGTLKKYSVHPLPRPGPAGNEAWEVLAAIERAMNETR